MRVLMTSTWGRRRGGGQGFGGLREGHLVMVPPPASVRQPPLSPPGLVPRGLPKARALHICDPT